MHFISKCIHLELNYWCISFLSSEFQDSGPHHAATVDTDRLRPGARYLYLQSPAAGLCNWMQIFIWAPVSCHVAFILHTHSLTAYRLSSTFTASKPSSRIGLRWGFPALLEIWVVHLGFACLCFFQYPNPNIIIVKSLYGKKVRQRQATYRNVLCLWLSFRMLPTKTDRSPAFSAHTPAPAACLLSDLGKCVLCGPMRPRARG